MLLRSRRRCWRGVPTRRPCGLALLTWLAGAPFQQMGRVLVFVRVRGSLIFALSGLFVARSVVCLCFALLPLRGFSSPPITGVGCGCFVCAFVRSSLGVVADLPRPRPRLLPSFFLFLTLLSLSLPRHSLRSPSLPLSAPSLGVLAFIVLGAMLWRSGGVGGALLAAYAACSPAYGCNTTVALIVVVVGAC